MAYIPTGSLSDSQVKALLDIAPEEMRALPVDRRLEIVLQHAEYQARKKEAFWNAVQAFATGALPILAFFGISKVWKK